ncbi:nitrogenase iron-molybdenum cofactor biosynthesis protein NifE, partial [Klebsiella variicola]|nr:nitrogenase iron-molybdenum cofactor biosynthesis protein NifE [Klebsiella variicola]
MFFTRPNPLAASHSPICGNTVAVNPVISAINHAFPLFDCCLCRKTHNPFPLKINLPLPGARIASPLRSPTVNEVTMKGKEILALLDEPACEHNQKQKSGCSAPKPGATAGGCAFDGAQITLLPIAEV